MKERGSVELGHKAHASALLIHLLECTDMDMQVIFFWNRDILSL